MEKGFLFHEEQRFRQPWLMYIVVPSVVFFLSVVLVMLYHKLMLGQNGNGTAMSDSGLIIISVFIMLVLFAVLYLLINMRLIVTVDQKALHLRFYPFVRKTIPISEIKLCKAATYRPIMEYGGWGIRFSIRGRGRAYTVSGNRGVDIVLKDGERMLIGSERPEEFEKAVSKLV